MTLKPTITAEERNALSADLQSIYVENNGQWILDAEVDAHPRVRALKKAYDSTKDELQKIRAAVPEDGQEEGRNVSVDERLAHALKQRDSLIAQTREESNKWRQQAHESAKQYEAALAVNKLKVKSPGLMTLKLTNDSAVDKNGKVYVRDRQGQPVLRPGAIREDDYLPLADYGETLRNDPEYGYLFEPNGAKGSNAQPNPATTRTAANVTTDEYGTLHIHN